MNDEVLCNALRYEKWDEAADRIEALTEQLNICRMAQVVMENGIAEAEKERDDYAFKLADANNTYSEMHVALSEANDKLATCEKYRDAYAECDRIGTQAVRDLEAKLAKAVEALRYYAVEAMPWEADDSLIARTTLAEIEGEKGEEQEG